MDLSAGLSEGAGRVECGAKGAKGISRGLKPAMICVRYAGTEVPAYLIGELFRRLKATPKATTEILSIRSE
jgi:hypothetical protein